MLITNRSTGETVSASWMTRWLAARWLGIDDETFLRHEAGMLVDSVKQAIEYSLIKNDYGDRTTERSGVPLINHIHEGLTVMALRGCEGPEMRAYCLHPLFQLDDALKANLSKLSYLDPTVTCFVMEYRNVANAYLSRRKIQSIDEIRLSPIPQVNEMLVADKIQNFKDFVRYHQATHERSAELTEYFTNWFHRFGLGAALAYIQEVRELPPLDLIAR